jgi:hypothetical protein
MEPPNKHIAKTCMSCKHVMFLYSDKVGRCLRFDVIVLLPEVCDDWEEIKEKA